MTQAELIAVTSRSFSRHPKLRECLQRHFPSVKFNEDGAKLTGEALKHFLSGAKRAIIGLEVIDAALLDALPDLKAICKVGTGIDKVDVAELNKRAILFAHTPGVNKRSVSELVLGLIFTALRHLSSVNRAIHQGQWLQPKGRLLSDKTVGIIGFGAIGQDIAALLQAFGCACLAYDVVTHTHLPAHVRQVPLAELLAQSDIISLHVPLTKENYHLIGERELSVMKKSAVLINTARGGLIDEKALYHALSTQQIAVAALDVFEHEPEIDPALLALNNFFATSHIGGSTEEAIEAMGMMAIQQLVKMDI